jgi:hypothetical protein
VGQASRPDRTRHSNKPQSQQLVILHPLVGVCAGKPFRQQMRQVSNHLMDFIDFEICATANTCEGKITAVTAIGGWLQRRGRKAPYTSGYEMPC